MLPPLFPGYLLSLLHPLSAGVLASMAGLVPRSAPGPLPSHSPLANLVLFPFLSAQLLLLSYETAMHSFSQWNPWLAVTCLLE